MSHNNRWNWKGGLTVIMALRPTTTPCPLYDSKRGNAIHSSVGAAQPVCKDDKGRASFEKPSSFALAERNPAPPAQQFPEDCPLETRTVAECIERRRLSRRLPLSTRVSTTWSSADFCIEEFILLRTRRSASSLSIHVVRVFRTGRVEGSKVAGKVHMSSRSCRAS